MPDDLNTQQQGGTGVGVKEILLFVVVLILSIGVPEMIVRMFWEPPPPDFTVGNRRFTEMLSQLSLGQGSGQKLYRDDQYRLWSLEPGKAFASFNPHFFPNIGEQQAIKISINNEGYRGELVNRQKPPSTLRILCMGDSNFFGYPLDDNDTFPTALQRALNRDDPSANVEVVNAGIPGYSVVQGTIWFEEQFREYEFDWLLLSYLNNDAWPHPQTDEELLSRYRYVPGWFRNLGKNLQVVQWAGSLLAKDNKQVSPQPRVPLGLYLEKYQYLIKQARERGARVMILDYRAEHEGYADYSAYSKTLQTLAEMTDVEYVSVLAMTRQALQNQGSLKGKYDISRVQGRWGGALDKLPYLYLYAEYYPEHLNEVGTAWLADLVAPILLSFGTPKEFP